MQKSSICSPAGHKTREMSCYVSNLFRISEAVCGGADQMRPLAEVFFFIASQHCSCYARLDSPGLCGHIQEVSRAENLCRKK